MKKKFFGIISVLLAVTLAFSVPLNVCAAKENSGMVDYDGYPLIMIRGMDFNGIYYKCGTDGEQRCFKGIEFFPLIKAVGKAVFSGVSQRSIDAAVEEICDYLNDVMGLMACNKDGSSKYDVSVYEYPLSLANYPGYKEWGTLNEMGILQTAAENYGAENVYYFNYDWRIDPFINAEKIDKTVKQAMHDSGKDKVNLVCCSMGGIQAVSYIYKYGSSSLNKVIFLSSTAAGTHVTTDVLCGRIAVTPDRIYKFLSQSIAPDNPAMQFIINALSRTGVFKTLSSLLNVFIEKEKDTVYKQFLTDTFGTMPSIWALVLPEGYDEAIGYMFGGKEEEYSSFIKLTEKYQKMAAVRDGLLRTAEANGTSICFVAGYNRCCIPVYDGGGCNGDGTLEADRMLGGAVIAPFDSTLGKDYVPVDPSRLSPDGMVDLSGVIFPESTWAVRNLNHVGCTSGTDSSGFLFSLLGYEGRVTVTSLPEYPQFMYSTDGYTLAAQ